MNTLYKGWEFKCHLTSNDKAQIDRDGIVGLHSNGQCWEDNYGKCHMSDFYCQMVTANIERGFQEAEERTKKKRGGR